MTQMCLSNFSHSIFSSSPSSSLFVWETDLLPVGNDWPIYRLKEKVNAFIWHPSIRVCQLVICLLTYASHQLVHSWHKLSKIRCPLSAGKMMFISRYPSASFFSIGIILSVYLDKQSKDNVLGHQYTISHLAFSIFFLECICVCVCWSLYTCVIIGKTSFFFLIFC